VLQYQKMYDESIAEPEAFWGRMAEEFHWDKKVCTVLGGSVPRAEALVAECIRVAALVWSLTHRVQSTFEVHAASPGVLSGTIPRIKAR
jgi:hypothetical protein